MLREEDPLVMLVPNKRLHTFYRLSVSFFKSFLVYVMKLVGWPLLNNNYDGYKYYENLDESPPGNRNESPSLANRVVEKHYLQFYKSPLCIRI